jgi:predicted dehydrogenase
MVEMAEAQGVKTLVNFSYRWMPFFRYFYDLAQQDYVGRLYHAEFRYLTGYARGPNYMWRFDQDRANGVLGDLGSHFIHLAHWLVGDIRRVRAQLGTFVQREGANGPLANPANDSALLLVEFAGGAHGVIHASSVAHEADRGMQHHVSLFGEGGTLEITANYGGAEEGAVIRAARAGENAFQTLPVPESYWAGVDPANPWGIFTQHSAGARAFVDALLDDGPAAPNFRDGYKAQQVIDAAYASHRSGEAISIAGA